MRIFNESKTVELLKQDCDLAKGYLKEELLDNGETKERVFVYTPYTQKQMYMKEADALRYWFANEYKEMFEKCSRKIALGINLRDGTNPSTKLSQLYAQAEIYSNRINELETLIKLLN